MGRSGGSAKRKISSSSSLSRSATSSLARVSAMAESEGPDLEAKLAILEGSGVDYKSLVLRPPVDFSLNRDMSDPEKRADFFEWENDVKLLRADPSAQSMLLDPAVFDIEIESAGDFDFLSYKRKDRWGFFYVGFVFFSDKKVYAIAEERSLDGYFIDTRGNLENRHHNLFRPSENGEHYIFSGDIKLDDSIREGYRNIETNTERRINEERAQREYSGGVLDKVKSGLSSNRKKHYAKIERREEMKKREREIQEEEKASFRDSLQKSIVTSLKEVVLGYEKETQKPDQEEKKKQRDFHFQRREWQRRRRDFENRMREEKKKEEQRGVELAEEAKRRAQMNPTTPLDDGGYGGGRPGPQYEF